MSTQGAFALGFLALTRLGKKPDSIRAFGNIKEPAPEQRNAGLLLCI